MLSLNMLSMPYWPQCETESGNFDSKCHQAAGRFLLNEADRWHCARLIMAAAGCKCGSWCLICSAGFTGDRLPWQVSSYRLPASQRRTRDWCLDWRQGYRLADNAYLPVKDRRVRHCSITSHMNGCAPIKSDLNQTCFWLTGGETCQVMMWRANETARCWIQAIFYSFRKTFTGNWSTAAQQNLSLRDWDVSPSRMR